ncbi:MAG: hypothetical protein JSR09_09590 [Bacteroidetes bacterium]|nr:hypothetical protein [Bacteroidota bacterium]MBS1649942.1 hypothetical protein [Bacteroidota bacterium]
MHQRYTLSLLLMVACIATANAQTHAGGGKQQQVTIPVTAQTANNAQTEYLPVFAGSRYNIEASFTATAKKTTLSKILKAAGLATATYQTTQNIAWGKGQLKTANPNWLIPAGLGVALGADKLLPHKKAIAYIRYTLYNTDTAIQQVYIEPVSGNKKPVVFNGTVPANGFLTVAFLNTKLIPVTGGNITVSIQQFTDDDNLPVVKKILDTQLLLPEKKALVLPQIEPVPPVLPALYAVAESTAVIVNPITKKGNSHNTYNPPTATPLKTQSSINKTLHLPNPLPQPVVPETPTIPLPFFLWEALPPKRFVINEEEPEPEPIDDGEHYALFDDSYSIHSGWGPPLPDVTVVSPPSPQPPPPDPSYPSYDDGGGGDGGGGGDDGDGSGSGDNAPSPCVTLDTQYMDEKYFEALTNTQGFGPWVTAGSDLLNYLADMQFTDLMNSLPNQPIIHYNEAPPGYHIDADGKMFDDSTGEQVDGSTALNGIDIYISKTAFKDPTNRMYTLGHELMHAYIIQNFPNDFTYEEAEYMCQLYEVVIAGKLFGATEAFNKVIDAEKYRIKKGIANNSDKLNNFNNNNLKPQKPKKPCS